MLQTLPLELITPIFHNLSPLDLQQIVDHVPEWKPWVMALNRTEYIEKWFGDIFEIHKTYRYNVKKEDDLATIIQNYWFMIIKFDNDTYQKITHKFPQIPNSKYVYLDVSYTNISDVNMLSGLHTLNCSHTQVSDVSMLGGLHTLDIRWTPVSDVSMLGGLHTLDCSKTRVSDVSMLGGLHTLNCSWTKVSDVSMLGGLNTLYCYNTRTFDVSMLEGKVKKLYSW